MNHSCCGDRAGDNAANASHAARTFGEAAAWIASGAALFLMPKCPVCIAAYIAAATGLGVSVSSAGYARLALLTICTASIAYLVLRRLRRSRRRRDATVHQV